MRPILDRMPFILTPDSFDTWLTPSKLPNNVLEFFLKPYDSYLMKLWPVATVVNTATNQGEHLIKPITLA